MSRYTIFHFVSLVLAVCLFSCCQNQQEVSACLPVCMEPEYADGFEILGHPDSLSRLIRIKTSWQGTDSTSMELFIQRGGEKVPAGFHGQQLCGNARRIAALSSSYVAMLDAIGAIQTVRAVSGLDLISNPAVQACRDSIQDIGYDQQTDYERLLQADPDLVLLYGIDGAHMMQSRLESLGIPYLYMGEYLEPDPLGRAEWLAVVGEVTGRKKAAQEAFRRIEQDYLRLKESASHITDRPLVMLNTPYGDNWFMSSTASAMTRLIEDAGAHYVYEANHTNRSLPIDLEEAYLLAARSDYWLHAGPGFRTLKDLERAWPKFSDVPAIVRHRVYDCDRRTNPAGGNDFWETGPVRPDLILADLIEIFHPGLLDPPHELYFYRRLPE